MSTVARVELIPLVDASPTPYRCFFISVSWPLSEEVMDVANLFSR